METFVIDAFTDVPFRGNPAGVCLTESDPTEATMLLIARELGFSETAFVRVDQSPLPIRYFSPQTEIPLCGHATLASARALFASRGTSDMTFVTRDGTELWAHASRDAVTMKFPSYVTEPAAAPPLLLDALGLTAVRQVVYNRETRILMLEIESTEVLAGLSPDFQRLRASHDSINGVLVTAPADDGYDFHSRYFWPWSGTDEDPVTGGTHTFLAPYWSARLGRHKLRSFQSSARTGAMEVEIDDDGVVITGQAVVVLRGRLDAAIV